MSPSTELFTGRRSWLLALVGVVALACAMRYVGIGKWSFASDELGTFVEAQQLFGRDTMAADDPDHNVAKMVPLATTLHAAGHELFGKDERGSRTMPAIFGVVQIICVGFGLRSLVGKTPALAAALLLTFSPEHLFYCQYHRFYAPAALFGSLSLLAGARSVRAGSGGWMIVAVIAAMAGVLVHALLGLLFGGLVAGVILASLIARGGRNRGPLLVALAGCVIGALYAVLYLYPLGKDKAMGYSWTGYSIPQAVFSGISQVGWPVALMAGPGLLLLWRRDRVQAAFWGVLALVWASALVILPRVLPFHSAYVFALNLPMFVLAAMTVGDLVDAICSRNRIAALAIFGVLLLFDLPAIASYYQDGSRHDFRAAAKWLGEHVGPNDLIVAVQGDKLTYYEPQLADRWQKPPLKDVPAWIDERRPKDGKIWIMLPGGRGGLPEPWREWAERDARIQATIVHRRFDYHEYPVFILLEDRPKR